MLKDHGKAGPLLSDAAKQDGIAVPTALDEEHQQKLTALQQSDASNMDQAYLSTQVTAHQQAVELFESFSKEGPDGQLKRTAAKILPDLRMHLTRIQGLTKKMKPVASDEYGLNKRDLARAHLLNRILACVPRYHTTRRWNARLLQGLVVGIQRCLPDLNVIRGRSWIWTIETDSGRMNIRSVSPPVAPSGLYIHFHGGAWVMGNARLEDGLARRIARHTGCVAAAVDFDNALDDRLNRTVSQCVQAAEWLIDHLDQFGVDRALLGGESSGAHLAAECLLHLRSSGKHSSVAGFYSTCGAFDLGGSSRLGSAPHDSLLIDAPAALANLRRLTPSLPNQLRLGPLDADLAGLAPALFVAARLIPSSMTARRCTGHGNGRIRMPFWPSFPKLLTVSTGSPHCWPRR